MYLVLLSAHVTSLLLAVDSGLWVQLDTEELSGTMEPHKLLYPPCS